MVTGAGGVICMAAYRPEEQLFGQQLRSIRDQSVADWQCIIAADGDMAGVREQVARQTEGDPRFVVVGFETRVGFYRNFERALETCRGANWIALSDQDDRWEPRRLEVMLPALEGASLVVCQARIIHLGPSGTPATSGRTSRRYAGPFALLTDNSVTGCMAVLHPEVLDVALPFPEPTDAAYHDHWLALCGAASRGITIIDEVLQDYVQHGNNVIGEHSTALGQAVSKLLADEEARGRRSPALRGLDRLAVHRFGWRVEMSNTLLQRAPQADAGVSRAAQRYASGNLANLLAGLASAAVRQQVSARRALGLAVGACWSRLSGKVIRAELK